MATYVTLYNYTDQGLKNIKDAPHRVEAAKRAAKDAGMTIKEVFWLQGQHDFLTIIEATDEVAMTAFQLNVLKQGNVRTHTMRAFNESEFSKVLDHLK